MEQHSSLNIIDLAVFAVILLSGALALWRGFVRELLSLMAWVGAILITIYFFSALRPWMHHQIKSDQAADIATGLTLFCGALIVLIPIGYLIGGLVRGKALTAIDRSLGFVFGLVRGALVVCLLFLITLWVWPEKDKEPEVLAQAKTRPFMADGAEIMRSYLPEDKTKKTPAEAKDEKNSAPSLDQPPTPAAVTATATTVKTDSAGDAKPANPSSSKDEVRQVIDELLSPPPEKPSGKP